MSFKLQHSENVVQATLRVTQEQITKALEELNDKNLDEEKTVHQVRKRCKKIRALVRLVRPQLGDQYQLENRGYRDCARQIGSIRDAHTMANTFEEIRLQLDSEENNDELKCIQERLSHEIEAKAEGATHGEQSAKTLDHKLEETEKALTKGLKRTKQWKMNEADELTKGLKQIYKSARKTMHSSAQSLDSEDLHTWRKNSKYFTYQMNLLRPAWGTVMKALCKDLAILNDLLGDDHDLSVLKEMLLKADDQPITQSLSKQLQEVIQTKQNRLRHEAFSLGARIFAESPKAFFKRMEQYYQLWQQQNQHKQAIAA